jgi:acyl-CoA thioesterase FadM
MLKKAGIADRTETFAKKGFSFFVVNINISCTQQVINKVTQAVCDDADITFVIADLNGKPVKLAGELKDTLKQIPVFEG